MNKAKYVRSYKKKQITTYLQMSLYTNERTQFFHTHIPKNNEIMKKYDLLDEYIRYNEHSLNESYFLPRSNKFLEKKYLLK